MSAPHAGAPRRERGVYVGPSRTDPRCADVFALDHRGIEVARMTVPAGGETELQAGFALFAFLAAAFPLPAPAAPELRCEAGGTAGSPAPRGRALLALVH